MTLDRMAAVPRPTEPERGRRRARLPAVLGAVVGIGLLTPGCGAASSRTAGTAGASGSSTGPVTITTVKGRDGTYLTDGSGRTLYMWLGDGAGKSNCSGDCALSWPPLITSTAPRVTGKASAADVGTTTRAGGGKQVTYKGHPLYHFVVDSGPGTTKGQGSDSFGARWWLVAPSGAAITVNGGSPASPLISY
jgi:predicted lipoprotein with Yx(FWY)xxD motif